MVKPEEGASVEETSAVLDGVWLVLFWYTELSEVLKTVLLLDTGAVEIVDTALEFAALLVGDTNAA